ncbi:hypothetical protein FOMPIDRAFT_94776, partial [Fomitopsis schrenkii]
SPPLNVCEVHQTEVRPAPRPTMNLRLPHHHCLHPALIQTPPPPGDMRAARVPRTTAASLIVHSTTSLHCSRNYPHCRRTVLAALSTPTCEGAAIERGRFC